MLEKTMAIKIASTILICCIYNINTWVHAFLDTYVSNCTMSKFLLIKDDLENCKQNFPRQKLIQYLNINCVLRIHMSRYSPKLIF